MGGLEAPHRVFPAHGYTGSMQADRNHLVDSVMVRQRAASFTKRSIKADAKTEGLRLAISMLDLTTLEGKDSPEKVRALCRKAIAPYETPLNPSVPSVAAVCVYPSHVRTAAKMLSREPACKVASVATGFPSGQYPTGGSTAGCHSRRRGRGR